MIARGDDGGRPRRRAKVYRVFGDGRGRQRALAEGDVVDVLAVLRRYPSGLGRENKRRMIITTYSLDWWSA